MNPQMFLAIIYVNLLFGKEQVENNLSILYIWDQKISER